MCTWEGASEEGRGGWDLWADRELASEEGRGRRPRQGRRPEGPSWRKVVAKGADSRAAGLRVGWGLYRDSASGTRVGGAQGGASPARTRPQSGRGTGRGLTCSNSSVMVLGSSCLWNHIMYLVWNRHDCFFRALAARYCALVPWGGKDGTGDQAASQPGGGQGDGAGRQGWPQAPPQTEAGLDNPSTGGWGTKRTNAGQEKESEAGGGNCFQRSFEKRN